MQLGERLLEPRLADVFGVPPPAVLSALVRTYLRLGLDRRLPPIFNAIVSNVPGPPVPLYCMGARMLEAYPMVPLAKNLNLGVAILSYCGYLHLGLLADRDHWPDLDVLEAGLEESFAELHKAATER